MTLEKFVSITFEGLGEYENRNSIVCKDGFNMSVQGSKTHYCSPRENLSMYASMEIGYPSKLEELILPFAECKNSPTQTVYGWVDVDIIQSVIDKHGGIDIYKTFKKN